MAIDTFDPAQVLVTFNGFLLTGFVNDTFITAERKEDTWLPYVGADGETARARNRNKSGTVTLTLMQTSSANDFLSSQHNLDEQSGLGTGALLVKDTTGRTLVNGTDAYVLKPAPVEFGKEIVGREWTFEVPQLDVTVGGTGPT